MIYIENNENVTREYEVLIDDGKLESVIKKLNEKCCRALKKTVRVTSNSKEEAIERINSTDNHGINIVREIELSDNYGHLKDFTKQQYIYECEFYYNQVSYLEYLLNIVLMSYRSKFGMSTDVSKSLNLILDYENNDELKTYQERMALEGITKELYFEYENNKDFDFELLHSLYQEAKECFKLKLVSETIHYDLENDAKVYKLGTRK